MKIDYIKVNNFRAFRNAVFEFKLGMNVIVGINGAGKSSLLDLLRIIISRSVGKFYDPKIQLLPILDKDFSIGTDVLTVETGFSIDYTFQKDHYTYILHKNLEAYRHSNVQGDVRQQTIQLPDIEKLQSLGDVFRKNPVSYGDFVVFYSPRRSIPISSSKVNQKYDDALSYREMNLWKIAQWWLVQKSLSEAPDIDFNALLKGTGFYQENDTKPRKTNKTTTKVEENTHKKQLAILEEVTQSFLDGCKNLRAIEDPEITLIVDKNGKEFDIRQLSDGERGMLALAFDLSMRILEHSHSSSSPLTEAEGIVLIDELDLHLHPRWQRDIVNKLTKTFPKCQFIVTTHSPQIIGEVPPENIIILEEGKAPYRPDQSLGMDTNWILEFLMDTKSRNPDSEKVLDQISDWIEDGEYEKAQEQIEKLKQTIWPRDPELLKLQARLERYKIMKENNSEK